MCGGGVIILVGGCRDIKEQCSKKKIVRVVKFYAGADVCQESERRKQMMLLPGSVHPRRINAVSRIREEFVSVYLKRKLHDQPISVKEVSLLTGDLFQDTLLWRAMDVQNK